MRGVTIDKVIMGQICGKGGWKPKLLHCIHVHLMRRTHYSGGHLDIDLAMELSNAVKLPIASARKY